MLLVGTVFPSAFGRYRPCARGRADASSGPDGGGSPFLVRREPASTERSWPPAPAADARDLVGRYLELLGHDLAHELCRLGDLLLAHAVLLLDGSSARSVSLGHPPRTVSCEALSCQSPSGFSRGARVVEADAAVSRRSTTHPPLLQSRHRRLIRRAGPAHRRVSRACLRAAASSARLQLKRQPDPRARAQFRRSAGRTRLDPPAAVAARS